MNEAEKIRERKPAQQTALTVHVDDNGRRYIDTEELFSQPRVKRTLTQLEQIRTPNKTNQQRQTATKEQT